MNDPNGLIQWGELYHLFYQHNPAGPFHDRIQWGHAVSVDLVHWEDWPIALVPTGGGPDEDGCWSGCAVDQDGVPTLVYTGYDPQTVCLATSADGLRTWQKHAGNPVLARPPAGLDTGTPYNLRDPYVWREGKTWYMLLASKIVGIGGSVLLYRSDDLVNWTYLHPLLVGDMAETEPFWTGTEWECPNFFPLGDKHVLVVSVKKDGHDPSALLHVVQFTGTYRDQRFTAETQSLLDYGSCYYAPQVMRDAQGRALVWGWLWEERGEPAVRSAGWAGVMSVPRVLDLRPGGGLTIRPVDELQALRGAGRVFQDVTLTATSANPLAEVQGDCLELLVEFGDGDAAEFGIDVRCSPDRQEYTRIAYDRAQDRVTLDRAQSSTSPDVRRDERSAPVKRAAGEALTLRVFLDRSVIEVYVNDRVCLTSRVYPAREDSLGVQLFARGGRVTVERVAAWPMRAIW